MKKQECIESVEQFRNLLRVNLEMVYKLNQVIDMFDKEIKEANEGKDN